jgi:hypothetical protein
MMTLWNYIFESYNLLLDKCERLYNYIKDYYYGHHDIWVFIPGHTFPLSLNNIYNSVDANWIYDNFTKSLSINMNSLNQVKCKFAWLSSKIVIEYSDKPGKGIEYNIDDFLEQFTLNTVDDITPTLYVIFTSWCAYNKHWFNSDDYVEFHVIDNNGDEIVLTMEDHNDSLVIKHNKIHIVIHSDDKENIIIEPEDKENIVVEPDEEKEPLIEETKTKED